MISTCPAPRSRATSARARLNALASARASSLGSRSLLCAIASSAILTSLSLTMDVPGRRSLPELTGPSGHPLLGA
jgi:hypothetical protein